MPKARPGRSASRRLQRERPAITHLEEMAAQATPPERASQDTAATTSVDPEIAGPVTTSMRPESGIASGPVADTTVMADLTEAVNAVPGVEPSVDGIDVEETTSATPAGGSTNLSVNLSVTAPPEPHFAPVPLPVPKDGQVMTDEPAAQEPASPRGRMTDRYTVWSRAARQSIDAQPQAPTAGAVDVTEQPVSAAAAAAGDAPGVQSTNATSTGHDLAMTRLHRATSPAAPETWPPSATPIEGEAMESLAGSVGDTRETAETRTASIAAHGQQLVEAGEDRIQTLVDEAGTAGTNAAVPARETASAQADELRQSAAVVGSEASDAGTDVVAAVAAGAGTASDEIAGVAGDVADSVRTAGQDLASVVDERLDQAEDRVEETIEQVAETGQLAGREVAGTIGRAVGDIQQEVAGAGKDLLATGRETLGDARRIATGAAGDASSGVADAARSIGGTAQETAEFVSDRVRQATQRVGETVTGTAGAVRRAGDRDDTSPSPATGGSASETQEYGSSADTTGRQRDYRRLVVSAVAISISSGFIRWALRRLTGADIRLLGPARIRPAILGSGIAALIASLYAFEDQDEPRG